jgi:hypothetical protein
MEWPIPCILWSFFHPILTVSVYSSIAAFSITSAVAGLQPIETKGCRKKQFSAIGLGRERAKYPDFVKRKESEVGDLYPPNHTGYKLGRHRIHGKLLIQSNL